MRVIKAQHTGYCQGVARAIDTARRARAENTGNVYTAGRLIHNKEVVFKLEHEGIKAVDGLDEVADGETVVIRAHGVGADFYEKAAAKRLKVYDATCVFVKKIHSLVANTAAEVIIIIGDSDHAEVKGIVGHSVNKEVIIINPSDSEFIAEGKKSGKIACGKDCDFEKLAVIRGKKAIMVAQTTLPQAIYLELAEKIRGFGIEFTLFETQCYNTTERLKEAVELSKRCGVVLVAGDKNSANTLNLFWKVSENTKAYLVQNADDVLRILPELKAQNSEIAVVSVASTPLETVNEIFGILTN